MTFYFQLIPGKVYLATVTLVMNDPTKIFVYVKMGDFIFGRTLREWRLLLFFFFFFFFFLFSMFLGAKGLLSEHADF